MHDFIDDEDGYRPDAVADHTARFVVLSGCSGGGKSALLAELGRRRFAVRAEPGRQVIREQHFIGGDAVPAGDIDAFVALTVSRSIFHLVRAVRHSGITFFDRGIVDQVAGLVAAGRPAPGHLVRAAERLRYRAEVFMVPPWPELFAPDAERTHDFAAAVRSYETLLDTYARYGYTRIVVPKASVAGRADFILEHLGTGQSARK